MEISTGKTGYVLFVDLRKELKSLTYRSMRVSCRCIYATLHDERNSQVICLTKPEGHLLLNCQFLVKRIQ